MKTRIKEIRKRAGMTQAQFARELGVSQGSIGNYETGVSEPANSVIAAICKTFSVSETWLRTGEGEMFLPDFEDELEAIFAKHNATPESRILIRKYLELPESVQDRIVDWICDFADSIDAEKRALESAKGEAAEYVRQVMLEKRPTEKSAASTESDLTPSAV